MVKCGHTLSLYGVLVFRTLPPIPRDIIVLLFIYPQNYKDPPIGDRKINVMTSNDQLFDYAEHLKLNIKDSLPCTTTPFESNERQLKSSNYQLVNQGVLGSRQLN